MTPIVLLIYALLPTNRPPDYTTDVYDAHSVFVGECEMTNDGRISSCAPAPGRTAGDLWTALLKETPPITVILDWQTYQPE